MSLCDMGDGLKLRVIEFFILISLFSEGIHVYDLFEDNSIKKENSFYQYDGPDSLDSLNHNFKLWLFLFLFFSIGIYIIVAIALPLGFDLIPRCRLSVYKVYFPMSFFLDLFTLIFHLESYNPTEIVPFFSIAQLYHCYHSELVFIFKYFIYMSIQLYNRYEFLGIVVFKTIVAVLSILTLKFIFANLLLIVDPNNFTTFEYCDSLNHFSQIARNADEILFEEKLKRHLIENPSAYIDELHREVKVTEAFRIPPYFHEKHERTIHEDTKFTCMYRFSSLYYLHTHEHILWSKDGSPIEKTSVNYEIKTTYSDETTEGLIRITVYSNLTVYNIKQIDYGEYQCKSLSRRKYIHEDVKHVNVYLDIPSTTIGRYHLVPREKKVSFIQIPPGNSIAVQWCPLHVINTGEDIKHNHFVDGRSITGLNDNLGNECSALSYFYHFLSYYMGFVNIPYPKNSNKVSHLVQSDLNLLVIWLHTCTYPDVYGNHSVSIIREIYNTKKKRMELVEIEHPMKKIIISKAPYFQKYDNKTTLNYQYNKAAVGFTDSDFLALNARLIIESLLVFAFCIIVILFVCTSCSRLGNFPVRKYILYDVNNAKIEKICPTFTVAIFCSETESRYWDDTTLQYIKHITKTEPLFIHRHFEHFVGRPLFEIYNEVYEQANAVIIHLTQSFVEDNECLHFQLQMPLTLIKEGKLSMEDVLLIHGDGCVIPNRIKYAILGIEVYDWTQITDKESQMLDLKTWIENVKSPKFDKVECNGNTVTTCFL